MRTHILPDSGAGHQVFDHVEHAHPRKPAAEAVQEYEVFGFGLQGFQGAHIADIQQQLPQGRLADGHQPLFVAFARNEQQRFVGLDILQLQPEQL